MAEKSGSRTHRTRLTRPTGFEDRAPHQGAIPFHLVTHSRLPSCLPREYGRTTLDIPCVVTCAITNLATCEDLVSWLDDTPPFTFSLGKLLLVEVLQYFDRHVSTHATFVTKRGNHKQLIVGFCS